jgi:hypothetical protein
MPAALTTYAMGRLYDALLGGRAYVGPLEIDVGLSTVPANGGGLVVEPAHWSYERVRLPNDETVFPSWGIVGVKSNLKPVVFGKPAADWGTVRSVFLAEPAVGGVPGQVLAMGDLKRPLRVPRGLDLVAIPPGSLVLSYDWP